MSEKNVRIFIPGGELSGLAQHLHSKCRNTPLPGKTALEIVEYHPNSNLNFTGVSSVAIIASAVEATAVIDAFAPQRNFHLVVAIPKGGALAAYFNSMPDAIVTHHLDDYGSEKFRAAIWQGLVSLASKPEKVPVPVAI